MNIDVGEWKAPWVRKQVIVHESSHHRHHTEDFIDKTIMDKQLLKDFDQKANMVKKRLLTDPEFRSKYGFFGGDVYRATGQAAQAEFPDIHLEDLRAMNDAMGDTIGALTKGQYGWMHAASYYKTKAWLASEWFVHAAENYYLGNPLFEKRYPELYSMMKETVARYAKK